MHQTTRFLRKPGTWRKHNSRCPFHDLHGLCLVVPNYFYRATHLRYGVHQIVGKRIVIVQNSYHNAKVAYLIFVRMKKTLHTDLAPAAIGPYSQAVRAGDFVFISGQIALNPATGELDAVDLETEVKRVLSNLETILVQAAGGRWEDVVKCTIFLTDMADFAVVNALYAEKFHTLPPARETVAVAGLPKGVRVEISAIVYLPL